MKRDTAILVALGGLVLAIVIVRLAAVTGHLPCNHRCVWCLRSMAPSGGLTDRQQWALRRIIKAEEQQWGGSETSEAFREIIAKYGSNDQPAASDGFAGHCKTCPKCGGGLIDKDGNEQGLCEEGYKLFKQDWWRSFR